MPLEFQSILDDGDFTRDGAPISDDNPIPVSVSGTVSTEMRGLTDADVVTAELSATDNAVLDALVTLLGRDVHNLVPNATEADQSLTVDATAAGVQFGVLHANTTHVFWSCEAAQCRVTFDASTPTTSNGHLIEPGDSGVWAKATAVAAKFIRTGAVSAVISASQMKGG